MTQITTQPCPHCGQPNPIGSTFCSSCGKALPMGMPTGPRVLGAGDLASTAAGQKLQGDELHKQSKKASGALLAVAIIQTIASGIALAVIQGAGRAVAIPPIFYVVTFGIAALFWGLWFWSRSQPLPAAIVGLVLYATLVVLNVISNVSQMNATGGPGTGLGGIGIGWIDILIIIVLSQAIQAGTRYRKLLAQQQAGY